MRRAVLRHDRVFGDVRDPPGHQLDIQPLQHPVPIIVAQHPLAVGRVARDHLGKQLLVILELLADVIDDQLAHLVVGFVERAVRHRPFRIHLQ